MTRELFEKKNINSEADLPKERSQYYFHDKVFGGIQSFYCPNDSPAVMKHLTEECDWYFKPLHLREELGLFNDWLNGAAKKYFTSPYIDEYLDSEYYLKSRDSHE